MSAVPTIEEATVERSHKAYEPNRSVGVSVVLSVVTVPCVVVKLTRDMLLELCSSLQLSPHRNQILVLVVGYSPVTRRNVGNHAATTAEGIHERFSALSFFKHNRQYLTDYATLAAHVFHKFLIFNIQLLFRVLPPLLHTPYGRGLFGFDFSFVYFYIYLL